MTTERPPEQMVAIERIRKELDYIPARTLARKMQDLPKVNHNNGKSVKLSDLLAFLDTLTPRGKKKDSPKS